MEIPANLDHYRPMLLQLGFAEKQWTSLLAYLRKLIDANESLNLVSRKMSFKELMENHVIDCLLPLRYFPGSAKKIADFGTGGGLPGILFALQFPEKSFHLYEKSPKKRIFLNDCRSLAKNIHIEAEIPDDFGGFDLVTARAFKPVDVIFNLSRRYLAQDGSYFLLKGRREKIDEELALAKKQNKSFGLESVQVVPLNSPVLEVERHLLLIHAPKLEETPGDVKTK